MSKGLRNHLQPPESLLNPASVMLAGLCSKQQTARERRKRNTEAGRHGLHDSNDDVFAQSLGVVILCHFNLFNILL